MSNNPNQIEIQCESTVLADDQDVITAGALYAWVKNSRIPSDAVITGVTKGYADPITGLRARWMEISDE